MAKRLNNKKHMMLNIDLDIYLTSVTSGENISALVNNFLKSYFNTDEDQTHKDILTKELGEIQDSICNLKVEKESKLKEYQKKIKDLEKELTKKQARIIKSEQMRKKDSQKKLKEIINANKAIRASRILTEIGR